MSGAGTGNEHLTGQHRSNAVRICAASCASACSASRVLAHSKGMRRLLNRARQPEQGYVVLSIVVLLMGAGTVWLSASTGAMYRSAQGYASLAERQGLINARQALLSYAALYPYLYGPTGAGPAHLPCPDTDGFNVNSPSIALADDQRRDGANPPCASLLESAGLLPRHTVLPGYRYLFHAEPWQRYRYTVAGDVVNNPLNRRVNLEQLTDHHRRPLALLGLYSDNDDLLASTPVMARALVRAASAAVAAWVVNQSRAMASRLCTQGADEPTPVQPDTNAAEACMSTDTDGQTCPYDSLLLTVIDTPVDDVQGCVDEHLDSLTIENTPARRHWFIRNLWYEFVFISGEESCIKDALFDSRCVLDYQKPVSLSELAESQRIVLHWNINT